MNLKRRRYLFTAGLVVSIFLTGCASTFTGTAPFVHALKARRDDLLKQFKGGGKPGEDFDSRYAAAQSSPAERDRLLWDLIQVIDVNYQIYERSLYDRVADTNLAAGMGTLGLNAWSTLSGAAGVKTTVAVLTTAIQGSQAEFNNEILRNQALPALIAKMRADRARQYNVILASMKKNANSVANYSIGEGAKDILDYYQNGTLAGAISQLSQDSALKQADSKNKLNDNLKKIAPLVGDSKPNL